ncbi:uncharacterized protein JN550_009190 [Neoarthrinium moseri]|uniref:uncharacterized protein n=1 Tax=Neoarthrinium moseri TaxID=1658444 RepID=UPI001FDD0F08|nr:uncharacterized protein JN550_009190 [Neoarthrinium moseri]KAI1863911.1 hypothetical protein JN550_009190 [Neoarthrinium moseri]
MAASEIFESSDECQVSPFVPAVLSALDNPAQQPVNVACTICHRILDISESVKHLVADFLAAGGQANSHSTFYKDNDIEQAAVLICGHLIGYECYKQLYTIRRQMLEDDPGAECPDPAACPICRQVLRFTDCKCPIDVKGVLALTYPLEKNSYDLMKGFNENVPLTLTEGAQLPRLCKQCGDGYLEGYELSVWGRRCFVCLHGTEIDIIHDNVAEALTSNHTYFWRLYLDTAFPEQVREAATFVFPECVAREAQTRARVTGQFDVGRFNFTCDRLCDEFEAHVWSSCAVRNPVEFRATRNIVDRHRSSQAQRARALRSMGPHWFDRNRVEESLEE